MSEKVLCSHAKSQDWTTSLQKPVQASLMIASRKDGMGTNQISGTRNTEQRQC